MSVNVKYANKKIMERFVRVIKAYFNLEKTATDINPLTDLPDIEAIFQMGFDLASAKELYAMNNIRQTAVFVSQDGPATYVDNAGCSPTEFLRDTKVPYKVSLVQRVDVGFTGKTYQLSDEEGRQLSIPEIAQIRGDLYVGLIEHIINENLPDNGVSVNNVFTISNINAGTITEEDWGTILYIEVVFEVDQSVLVPTRVI